MPSFTPALLMAVDSSSHTHLVIGSNPLAGARCARSLEVGARPILIAPPIAPMHYGLSKRIEDGEVEWVNREFQEDDLKTLGREAVDCVVDAVFVTLGPKDPASTRISELCRRLRIPVNVAEAPHLCTFTLLSTHNDGPLQIGVTTSGKGCKMASRIRREISSSLPPNLGTAVSKLGVLRRRIWEEDYKEEAQELEVEDDDSGQSATFNKLVTPEDHEANKTRRMRWLSQICEYWPLNRLATISDADVDALLNNYTSSVVASKSPTANFPSPKTTPTLPSSLIPTLPSRKPYITLAGSGPGSPHLLTLATLSALRTHPVILSDKLVPAAILSLIPRRTTVHIARKFPGSAEAAQEELLTLAEEGLKAGKSVLRLKQGDPYLFGRGGEEAKWFEERGWEVRVLPGITSALSAPLCAGVPVTQRGVSDGVLLVTGTGRKGKAPSPPTYMPTITVVFLMALHRLESLVQSLLTPAGEKTDEAQEEADTRQLPPGWTVWPQEIPVCIVERASCPDQRVIRSSLQHVVAAVEELGSRPPGLLIMGKACEVLRAPRGRWSVEEGVGGLCGGGMEGDGLEGLLGMVDGLGLKEGVVREYA